MIYFDNAATTMYKPEAVYRAADHAMRSFGNSGRGGYGASLSAGEALFSCREALGSLFGCNEPENIVFTFNATHGLNIAIKSLVTRRGKVLITGFEHNAVTRPLRAIDADVRVFGDRLFDADYSISSLKRIIDGKTQCVIINHVSNVFGFIQPIYELADICHKFGIPVIIDASQSAGILKIDQKRLNAAFIAMPGHKSLYGPQGTGVLICARRPKPVLYGGTGSVSESFDMPDFLPDMLEAGTLNSSGIAGLYEGVKYVYAKGTDAILRHERNLRDTLVSRLSAMGEIKLYYDTTGKNQTGVISFSVPGLSCEEIGDKLAERQIAVRAGLHCAPLAHISAGTFETGTVRVSFGINNTREQVFEFAKALEEIVKNR